MELRISLRTRTLESPRREGNRKFWKLKMLGGSATLPPRSDYGSERQGRGDQETDCSRDRPPFVLIYSRGLRLDLEVVG